MILIFHNNDMIPAPSTLRCTSSSVFRWKVIPKSYKFVTRGSDTSWAQREEARSIFTLVAGTLHGAERPGTFHGRGGGGSYASLAQRELVRFMGAVGAGAFHGHARREQVRLICAEGAVLPMGAICFIGAEGAGTLHAWARREQVCSMGGGGSMYALWALRKPRAHKQEHLKWGGISLPSGPTAYARHSHFVTTQS